MNSIVVLYICPDVSLGGSTRSLINMIESTSEKVKPIVLFPKYGPAVDYLRHEEVECIVSPFVLLHEFKRKSKSKPSEIILHPWRLPFIKYIRTDFKCAYYVKSILKNRVIDIVHSNFSPITIGCILSKVLKAKHVWHIREFLDLNFKFDIYGGIPRLKRLINKADARIAISSAVRDHWHLKQANTWTLLNPICKKEEACLYAEKEPYLLFCSHNLTEEKGARFTIQAFGASNLKDKGIRLRLVGNCNPQYLESLMQTAENNNCADSIDFYPLQDNVKNQFAKAKAFIMASICEGLGRVTAEAMFYGCPVIARASGGTLDLVRDHETGYLFTTAEECALLMNTVCNSDQQSIIEPAQQFAINNLSQEVYGPRIMQIYQSIL